MSIETLLEAQTFPQKEELDLGYDDTQKLFWKFKGLELEQKRKDSFWAATNDNLSKAYETLEEQELEIERAYQLNQTYLENIKEGLILINRDNIILGQFSNFVQELFEVAEIEGRNFVDFLYPDIDSQIEDREELSNFLEIVFGSTHASDAMVRDVNPLKNKNFRIGATREKEISVDASFIRITHDDQVTNLMVIFQDRTNEILMQKKLEYEEIRHDSELETISAILKNGPEAFTEFIEEAYNTTRTLKSGIEKLGQPAFRTDIFKRVHTLKGEAKYYELHFMAHIANSLEGFLSDGDAPDEGADIIDVHAVTVQLEECIEDIEQLSTKLQSFANFESKGQEFNTAVLMESIEDMIGNLATDLGKEVAVDVSIDCEEIPFIRKLQKPIIHIVRNAIDHGIEDPIERVSQGKNPQGTIQIEFLQQNGDYNIVISDDGAGIDLKGVAKKAVSEGQLPANEKITREKVLNLIFSPHFSSRDISSDVSGRGLGLDIVRDAMRELGGKINVGTIAQKGTKFTLTIPR